MRGDKGIINKRQACNCLNAEGMSHPGNRGGSGLLLRVCCCFAGTGRLSSLRTAGGRTGREGVLLKGLLNTKTHFSKGMHLPASLLFCPKLHICPLKPPHFVPFGPPGRAVSPPPGFIWVPATRSLQPDCCSPGWHVLTEKTCSTCSPTKSGRSLSPSRPTLKTPGFLPVHF